MAQGRFTLDDGKRWKRSYEEGMTYEEIALEERISPGTVRKWAKRAGVESRSVGTRSGFVKPRVIDTVKPSPSRAVHNIKTIGGKAYGKRRRYRL